MSYSELISTLQYYTLVPIIVYTGMSLFQFGIADRLYIISIGGMSLFTKHMIYSYIMTITTFTLLVWFGFNSINCCQETNQALVRNSLIIYMMVMVFWSVGCYFWLEGFSVYVKTARVRISQNQART